MAVGTVHDVDVLEAGASWYVVLPGPRIKAVKMEGVRRATLVGSVMSIADPWKLRGVCKLCGANVPMRLLWYYKTQVRGFMCSACIGLLYLSAVVDTRLKRRE